VAKGIFGSKVTFTAKNYDALRAPTAWCRTEWSEFRRPDFEKMRKLLRSPVIFDGRNLSHGADEEGGFTYYSAWPHLTRDRSLDVLVTGGAGYIGSHAAKALRRPVTEWSSYDNFSAGHREAALGSPVIEGDIRDVDAVRQALRDSGASAVMHFAAWLIVADSVRTDWLLPHNVDGARRDARGHGGRAVRHFIILIDMRGVRRAGRDADRRDAPDRADQCVRADEARGRARAAACERACGIRSIRLRYSTRPAPTPRASSARITRPRSCHPRAFDAASGGAPIRDLRQDYPTPDGTCLRDYIHVSDLADAHMRALRRLEENGASATYNVGTERPRPSATSSVGA